MSSFEYPEGAPEVGGHYEGDGCEFEFGPGVHNLGATPLRPDDAERLREFAEALRKSRDEALAAARQRRTKGAER
jgi:hypothetical protein